MTFTDVIILIVVIGSLATIIYFSFIKNKGKSACASCSSAKTSFVKEYYKCKCEGKEFK